MVGQYKQLQIVLRARLSDYLAIRKVFPSKPKESFADYLVRVKDKLEDLQNGR